MIHMNQAQVVDVLPTSITERRAALESGETWTDILNAGQWWFRESELVLAQKGVFGVAMKSSNAFRWAPPSPRGATGILRVKVRGSEGGSAYAYCFNRLHECFPRHFTKEVFVRLLCYVAPTSVVGEIPGYYGAPLPAGYKSINQESAPTQVDDTGATGAEVLPTKKEKPVSPEVGTFSKEEVSAALDEATHLISTLPIGSEARSAVESFREIFSRILGTTRVL